MTINQIIRERKKSLRDLKRTLRAVDSSLEKQERKINQQISRKIKVPELGDLEAIVEMTREMDDALTVHMRQLDVTRKVYEII